MSTNRTMAEIMEENRELRRENSELRGENREMRQEMREMREQIREQSRLLMALADGNSGARSNHDQHLPGGNIGVAAQQGQERAYAPIERTLRRDNSLDTVMHASTAPAPPFYIPDPPSNNTAIEARRDWDFRRNLIADRLTDDYYLAQIRQLRRQLQPGQEINIGVRRRISDRIIRRRIENDRMSEVVPTHYTDEEPRTGTSENRGGRGGAPGPVRPTRAGGRGGQRGGRAGHRASPYPRPGGGSRPENPSA